jgi:hypothetical protein
MKKATATKTAAGGAALIASAALAVAFVPGSALASANGSAPRVTTHAHLNPLNNSGASGQAWVVTHGHKLSVKVNVSGLAPGLPHAQHIHYGAEARHECPSASKDDMNGDFRLSTAEGLPAYGPIRVSLTTSGGTGPKSGLAVDRFPTAPGGVEHYSRMITAPKVVARAIRRGEGVLVIHGIDYNGNGKYDFASAGRSELDPNLPAEATDPAVCGVLRR